MSSPRAVGPSPATTDRRVPFVRVVTLNWNAAEMTARCVRSLLATEWPEDRLQVVVVDNASIDGSLTRLRSWFPTGVDFIANPANLGFSEGCNVALRGLDGIDHVALVNNDAVVDPGWLRPLVDALEEDDGLGAACPKLLFATPFAPVVLDPGGDAEVTHVQVDGLEVGPRCLWGAGIDSRPDRTVPLLLRRMVTGRARIDVPVAPGGEGTIRIGLRFADGTDERREVRPDGPPVWRINNLGTGRVGWNEGIDLRLGEPDRPDLPQEDVPGWCGGGVLLRTAFLEDAGRFDPRYFAYYEDTDLSWRGRIRGWRYRTVPESVVHHVHGGSGGASARGFFLLNYRNWILTALRNGDRDEIAATLRWAGHLAWGPTRWNVVGPLRRGRRPHLGLTAAWAGVGLGVGARVPAVLASRPHPGRVGALPTRRVRSPLQARPVPRPPARRAGGTLVVYLDVTSTLDHGWRAGIQRVTVELARHLPLVADVDLVAVRWSGVNRAYRRLTDAEWSALLHHAGDPPRTSGAAAPGGGLKERVRPVVDDGWRRVARLPGGAELARRVALRRQPVAERDLVLPRWERGAVFLDVDASWNVTAFPRWRLLDELDRSGVRIAWFVHDLLPLLRPDWFDPGLVEAFRAHALAHAGRATTFLANSRDTARTVATWLPPTAPAAGRTIEVVSLGSDPTRSGSGATGNDPLRGGPITTDAPVVLVVGTIEPRKGHATLLDAWTDVHTRVPSARLVVAGRAGWRADDVVRRLASSDPDVDGVLWLRDLGDEDLSALYRRAEVVVVPSVTEGYGLPVVEALRAGRAVVSGSGGALAEVGGTAVTRVDTGRVDDLAAAIGGLLEDHAARAAAERAARAWEPPRWDATARDVAAALGARPISPAIPPVPADGPGRPQR